MQPGFRTELKELPLDDGKKTIHHWQIVQWGRVIHEGMASTREKAQALMNAALGERVERLQSSGDVKREHRGRIRYHLHRRPYVALALARQLMAGERGQRHLVQEAEAQELYEWTNDNSPNKRPLRRKGGSGRQPMEAAKVVEQLIESMGNTGLVTDPEYEEIKFTGKGRKWALEMFGKEEFGL